MTRRRRRINRRLIKITSESTKLKLQIELVEIEHKLQKLYKNSANFKEKKAVDAIKKNPKFFFSYAKNHMKVKTKVGPLLNDKNTLTNNSMEMAEILSSQFTKMFSTPRVDNQESKCDSATHISKLIFNEQDLIAAIDELSSTSAPGPDNFPAIMLKNCKSTLAKPLTMIWTKSYNEGKVPQSLKECIITPTHKGGDKAAASNYRPIALTSHLIKIFEKILRNHLTNYLQENNMFNINQHGFRSGHSCLSQLLDHFDDILNHLGNDNNVDVVYLDFAKAFDKVDFYIVLRKIQNFGITGHVYNWIESFITKRTQEVIVDGFKSKVQEVKSGVPQGSVLGSLIFLLLLSDIDSQTKSTKVRSFADDTRIIAKAYTLCDMADTQTDLDTIYKWTELNNMVLNDKKFQLLRYGLDETIKDCTYYYSATGTIIKSEDRVLDLGVIMDSTGSFDMQIENIIEKGKRLSSWILRTFTTRTATTMLT